MEESTNNKLGNYIFIAIGLFMLLYAIYQLINGYSNGFQFHIWNLELRGKEALIINVTFIVACSLVIYSSLRSIKNESNK